jgi:opacity protein-like surface antigen
MKKIIILLSICISTQAIIAQGLYGEFSLGYALGTSKTNHFELDFSNTTSTASSDEYEQVNVSLGKGTNARATLGYMFNTNLGVELGASYLLGGKTTSFYKNEISSIDERSLSAKMFRLNPSFVVKGTLAQFNPYVKIGMIIGAGNILLKDDRSSASGSSSYTQKYYNGLAMGFSTNLGTYFAISESMSFLCEIQMINLSYSPNKAIYTEYSSDGTDVLPLMSTYEKEVEFVDNYVYDLSAPVNQSEPQKSLKYKFAFGSVGLNVGLKINF